MKERMTKYTRHTEEIKMDAQKLRKNLRPRNVDAGFEVNQGVFKKQSAVIRSSDPRAYENEDED